METVLLQSDSVMSVRYSLPVSSPDPQTRCCSSPPELEAWVFTLHGLTRKQKPEEGGIRTIRIPKERKRSKGGEPRARMTIGIEQHGWERRTSFHKGNVDFYDDPLFYPCESWVRGYMGLSHGTTDLISAVALLQRRNLMHMTRVDS